MDARRSRRQKKISLKQENSVAEAMGGRTQAASGGTRLGGGADVRAPGFRIECKYTEKDTYSLKRADLQKLKLQAARTLEQPVMQLAFVDNLGRRTEFAITKMYTSNIITAYSKKSIPLNKETLETTLLKERIVVQFEGDKEMWAICHWADFLRERQEC